VSYLLDTHVLLWALGQPRRLGKVRALIEAPETVVFVSAVSAWEIELKRALGKLSAPDDLEAQVRAARFAELPLRMSHVARLRSLPPHHRDPFDRALVAQALVEDLTLVTADPLVRRYPVRSLPV
jgi:PIN domain nuclease of toxin-antitoxin system